jgi:glycosyltransferase involved in cell wall biosynthesis
MRILLVAETVLHGVGQHLALLGEGLRARGHKVVLIYCPLRADPGILERLSRAGVRIEPLEMRRQLGLSDFEAVRRLRKKAAALGPFDVVHAHSSKAGGLARLALGRRYPVVYSPHAFKTMDPSLVPLARLLLNRIEYWLARKRSAAIIVTSMREMDHALALGLPRPLLQLVHNGVDERHFQPRTMARKALGLKPDQLGICFASRWAAQKAPERFLAIIEAAHEMDSRIVGVILSLGDIRTSDPLMPQIRSMQASGRLILRESRVEDHLAGCDIYLLTSLFEGMPHILVEAGQAGLALIAPDVGGAAEMIEPDVSGFLHPLAMNVDIAARQLGQLAADATRLDRLKQGARDKARHFEPGRMVEGILNVYARCAR